jgi:uncharacterized protein YkwD
VAGFAVLSAALVTTATPALAKSSKPSKHKETAEHALIHWVNLQRQRAGLRPVSIAPDLTALAHRHTKHMAKNDQVFHNRLLGSEVDGWLSLGEDVGSAASLGDLEQALLSSAADRANLLGPAMRQIGVGTQARDGLLYVTVITLRPSSTRQR